MLIPQDTAIDTERLTLRLVRQDDLPGLLEVNADDTVTRYLPYPSWEGMDDAQAWLDRALARLESGEAAQFTIVRRDTQAAIGSCVLFRVEEESRRAEMGYVLGRAHWGAGYAREAMDAFVRMAFEQLDLRRLEAEIDPRNTASARLLERLGFVHEGLQRERWSVRGEISDSALYGLLRGEWRARQ